MAEKTWTRENFWGRRCPDFSMQRLEDNTISNIMLENLRQCLLRLLLPKQILIRTIYYQGLTERQTANSWVFPT